MRLNLTPVLAVWREALVVGSMALVVWRPGWVGVGVLAVTALVYAHSQHLDRVRKQHDVKSAQALELAQTAKAEVDRVTAELSRMKDEMIVIGNRTRPVGGMR